MSEVRKLSYINDMDKEVKYTGSKDTKMTKIRSINLFLLSLLLLLPLTNPQTQTQMDKTQVFLQKYHQTGYIERLIILMYF